MKHLGTNQVCNCQFGYPHDNIAFFGLIDATYQSQQSFVTNILHLVADLSGVVTDDNKSCRPILAKYKHFETL